MSQNASIPTPESDEISVGCSFQCPSCGPSGRVKRVKHNGVKHRTNILCGNCGYESKRVPSGVFQTSELVATS